MKTKNAFLPFLIVVCMVALGGYLISNSLRGPVQNDQMASMPAENGVNTEDGIQVQAPLELIDEQSGEVDPVAFEQNQQVSSDDSFETLETELNSTIILQEDFSDL